MDGEGGSGRPGDAILAAGIRHVVIVGLMGSGKTTIGLLLASRLGWPMLDSDAEIEARDGRTVREIRQARGTMAIHDLEARALLDALAAPGPAVVCAAASVADRDDCLEALRAPGVVVVWLTATPSVAARRFPLGAHRPSYGDDPTVVLASQAALRGPRFRSLAPVELATDHRTPEALADEVLSGVLARVRDRP